jgi:glycosyltransferase involved in cell wall biosynthesis
MAVSRLTIVVPCVDEVPLLVRCLRSIAACLPGQRVIVVKMGGWDVDPAWCEGLDVRFEVQPRLSAAAARNCGARLADTDYVLFLDSDNWLQGDRETWEPQLSAALEQGPELVILQRGEDGRAFAPVERVTRWNFSRHCIEWNLVWSRRHFWALGGLDERCCTGSTTLAQAGEAFDICFGHFASQESRTLFVPLEVGHPSLDAAARPLRRQFEYAYGANYVVLRQLRRRPTLVAAFWFVRALGGLAADVARTGRKRSWGRMRALAAARMLAVWDGMTRDAPRPR